LNSLVQVAIFRIATWYDKWGVSHKDWNSSVLRSNSMATLTGGSIVFSIDEREDTPKEVLRLVAFLPFVGSTFNYIGGGAIQT